MVGYDQSGAGKTGGVCHGDREHTCAQVQGQEEEVCWNQVSREWPKEEGGSGKTPVSDRSPKSSIQRRACRRWLRGGSLQIQLRKGVTASLGN
jgi:hypothetical protein